MKKTLKIIGSILVILLLILIISPFLFKGKIESIVKKQINEQINATVSWSDINLSLLRKFPNASIQIKGISLINKAPFKGDTLAYIGNFEAKMGLFQLLKNEGIKVDELELNGAKFNIKIDSLGNTNYDIAVASEEIKTNTNEETPSDLQLNISHYEINNSSLIYTDETSKMNIKLKEFNHRGDGNFEAQHFDLNTHTDTRISFEMEGVNYMNNHFIQLDATLGIDLKQMKFSFLENKALINQLLLKFDGYIQLQEDEIAMDIAFSTPSTDFKNFLALIPEAYATDLKQVTTTGDFSVNGKINGSYKEELIPTFAIEMSSSNASFAYSELPKKVTNINFLIRILNTNGDLATTSLDIPTFGFQIDQDMFSGKLSLKDLTENMKVNLVADGKINLAHLDKAYPVEKPLGLEGMLMVNLQTQFAMEDLEKERYERVNTNGDFLLKGFVYEHDDLIHPYEIRVIELAFSNKDIRLQNFEMKTGKTDLKASGSLDNLLGYMFSKQDLKGRFKAASTSFYVSDFMVINDAEKGEINTESTTTKTYAIKIPAFLDLALDFTSNDLYYDAMRLQNTQGSMVIKNESIRFEDISAQLFAGTLTLKGFVSTNEETPNFNMQFGFNNVDIGQLFSQMNLAKNIAPIASALTGRISTNMDISGDLTSDFSPVLESLGGNISASIIQAKVNPEQTPLLNNLNSQLDFVDFSKMNLNNLTTQASLANGQLNVQPFDFQVEGVNVTTKGSHRLDGSMDYTMDVKVPAALLGKNISQQVASLSNQDLKGMTVDLPIGIVGSFTNPHIKLNLQKAISDFTKQIIATQKSKLEQEAQGKVEDKIRDLIGGEQNNKEKDATETKKIEDEVKDKVKDVLGGFLKGSGKK